MPYRIKPGVPLVIAKGEDGKLHHHYNQPVGGSIGYGAHIPWLNDEQREHFLRKGLVEEIDDEPAQVAPVVAWPKTAPAGE